MSSRTTPPVLTANICGGLGNQLFQVATLIGTSARSGVPMMLERAPLSSSIEEPRPTYWSNMLRKFTSDICVDVPESQRHILQQHQGNVVREYRGEAGVTIPQIEKIVLPKGDGSQSDSSIVSSPNFKNCCPSYNKNDPLFRLVGFFQSSQFFSDAGEAIKEVLTEESISMAAKQHLHRVYNRDAEYSCTELSMPGGGYVGLPASLLKKHKKNVEGSTNMNNSSSEQNGSSSSSLKADRPYIIGMHVRRGDYLRHTDTFEILPTSYYDEALQSLLGPLLRWDEHRVFAGFGKGAGGDAATTTPTTSSSNHQAASYLGLKPHRRFKLLIFTDDAAYGRIVAGSFMTKYPALDVMVVGEHEEREAGVEALTSVRGQSLDAVDDNSALDGDDTKVEIPLPRDVLDLHMMTHCHDLILANSSYSWWGAYLNQTPMCRVVAPSKWLVKEPYPAFSHIYEPRWTVL